MFAFLYFGGNSYAQPPTENENFGQSKIDGKDQGDWMIFPKWKHEDSFSNDPFYKGIDKHQEGIMKSISEKNKPLTADFSYKSGSNYREIKFTNNSTSATSYEWDFGDGNTATTSNPTYTYAVDGRYTVKLTVKNRAGQRKTATQIIEINRQNQEEESNKKSENKTSSKPKSPVRPESPLAKKPS